MALTEKFLKSENVDVFPSAFRNTKPQGKYTNEANFVNIINSIVDYNSDQDGFIVSSNKDKTNFEVVIHGYYFKISGADLSDFPNSCWLNIKVEKGAIGSDALVNWNTGISAGSINDIGEMIALDEGNEFTALRVSSDPLSTTDTSVKVYKLQILKDGRICDENRIKIKSSNVAYIEDGSKSLKQKLDEIDRTTTDLTNKDATLDKQKQNKLVKGSHIVLTDDTTKKTTTISVDDDTTRIVNSMTKGRGSTGTDVNTKGNRLIYSESGESAGEVKNSEAKIGKKYSSESGARRSQNVYVDNGVVTAGSSVWISTSAPPTGTNTPGENGDIWFKYQN